MILVFETEKQKNNKMKSFLNLTTILKILLKIPITLVGKMKLLMKLWSHW